MSILWDKLEVAILIDAYERIEKGISDYDTESHNLSEVLRYYGLIRDNKIDEKYRNLNGMNMKLHNMEFLFTDGKRGLSNCSSIERNMYWTYRNNNKQYRAVLAKAKERMAFDIIVGYKYEDVEPISGDTDISKDVQLELLSLDKVEDCSNKDEAEIINLDKSQKESVKFDSESNPDTGDNLIEVQLEIPNVKTVEASEAENNLNAYSSESFSRKYGINIDDARIIQFDIKTLSVRTRNCLFKAGVKSTSDLLQHNMGQLQKVKGFGKKCEDEIIAFLKSLPKNDIDDPIIEVPRKKIDFGSIEEYKDDVINGLYDIVEIFINDEDDLKLLNELKIASSDLGQDFVKLVCQDSDKMAESNKVINYFINSFEKTASIGTIIEGIPTGRLFTQVEPYINAYTESEQVKSLLYEAFDKDSDLCNVKISTDINVLNATKDFLRWCTFDIDTEIQALFESKVFTKSNVAVVVQYRATGETLQQVGERLNITRERVRQIESKAVKAFSIWNNTHKLLHKICAIRNNDTVLTPLELSEYFGDKTAEMLYLLRKTCAEQVYDKSADVFIVNSDTLTDKAADYVDGLPESFRCDELDDIVNAAEEIGITEELLLIYINNNYKQTGELYHRSRLTIGKMLGMIVRDYFPDGIHVYNDEELDRVREYALKDYGIDNLSSNHALSSRISAECIMCGKGTYKPKQDSYVPKKLLNDMAEFVDNNESSIIMDGYLYDAFEKELLQYEVDNRFFMHAIFREEYEDKYTFTRDYISKDVNMENVSVEVYKYIKGSDYPISKAMLKNQFLGLPDIMISTATKDKSIINLFGEYIHVSKLRLSNKEIEFLHDVITENVSGGGTTSSTKLYNRYAAIYPEVMNHAFIKMQYQLFSVLQALFYDEFNFERPFISAKNVEIGQISEQVIAYLEEFETPTISMVRDFYYERFGRLKDILEAVDDINDAYLLKNRKELVFVEDLSINEELIGEIETAIVDEISGMVPIARLKCVYGFSSIGVPWNEWLIYSVLKKYSSELDVGVSHVNFNMASPIVSLKGEFNDDEAKRMDISPDETILSFDELEDIAIDSFLDELDLFE